MNLEELTIESFAEGLRAKRFSARETTEAYLSAIDKSDPDIGAYLSVRGEKALREAELVDAQVASGESLSPLAGVPLALKDNMVMEGEVTTAASKMLEHYRGAYDATIVKKLRASGAVVLGKANLDEFAMGSSTEQSAFKKTRNPHDYTRVPGGSSGGSAAAVAGHLSLAALGSDTSGSISLPAAFCGVVGLRPTYGAVSRFGLIAMASSLDQIGPITRTVRDSALLFDGIRGRDPFDSTSIDHDYGALLERNDADTKQFIVGIPEEFFVSGIDPVVSAGLESALARLTALGFTAKKISLPHIKYALAVYYIIQPAEVSANLARFDGVRYERATGHQSPIASLHDLYVKTRGTGFGPEPRRRILLGTYVLSAGYYDAYYAKAQRVRRLIADDFENAFKEVDVIFAPVTPAPAFKFGEKSDPLSMYLSDVFTTQVNLAGLPSLSIPVKKYSPDAVRAKAGTVDSGELPIGFQLIGKRFRERDLFSIGELYERA